MWSSHIYGVTVSDPVKMILSLLESSSPIFLQSPNSSDQSEPKKRYVHNKYCIPLVAAVGPFLG